MEILTCIPCSVALTIVMTKFNAYQIYLNAPRPKAGALTKVDSEELIKLFVGNQVSSIWKQVFFVTFPVSDEPKTCFFEFLAKN